MNCWREMNQDYVKPSSKRPMNSTNWSATRLTRWSWLTKSSLSKNRMLSSSKIRHDWKRNWRIMKRSYTWWTTNWKWGRESLMRSQRSLKNWSMLDITIRTATMRRESQSCSVSWGPKQKASKYSKSRASCSSSKTNPTCIRSITGSPCTTASKTNSHKKSPSPSLSQKNQSSKPEWRLRVTTIARNAKSATWNWRTFHSDSTNACRHKTTMTFITRKSSSPYFASRRSTRKLKRSPIRI